MMRVHVLGIALLLTACGGGEREALLERRIIELEAVQSPPSDPRVQALQQRVDQLESLLRELRQLEIATQQSVAQMVEHLPPPRPTGLPKVPALDVARAYAVPIDDSPALGDANAGVTIVAAVQFPEPFTHRSWPVLQALRLQYGKALRIVVKMYVVHPQATASSIAACAVAYQGQLDVFEDALWSASTSTSANSGRRWPDAAEARRIAGNHHIDLVKFDRDVAGRCAAAEARDQQMFSQLGQAAVPVFWINGHPLEGARPQMDFQQVIDAELAKAVADRQIGGAPATYYERVTKPTP